MVHHVNVVYSLNETVIVCTQILCSFLQIFAYFFSQSCSVVTTAVAACQSKVTCVTYKNGAAGSGRYKRQAEGVSPGSNTWYLLYKEVDPYKWKSARTPINGNLSGTVLGTGTVVHKPPAALQFCPTIWLLRKRSEPVCSPICKYLYISLYIFIFKHIIIQRVVMKLPYTVMFVFSSSRQLKLNQNVAGLKVDFHHCTSGRLQLAPPGAGIT